MKTFFFSIFYSLLVLSSAGLAADELVDLPEDSGPSERWYRIELLIYRQKAEASTLPEHWSRDVVLSYPSLWVRLKSADEYVARPQSTPAIANWLSRIKTSPYTPFVLQPDSAKSFSKGAKQIQRFEGDILFHQVWWQPFIQNDNQEAPSILIQGGKKYGDHHELEGSVQFRLSRYLHVSTNLWLTDFLPIAVAQVDGQLPPLSAWPELPLSPDAAAALPVVNEDGSLLVAEQPLFDVSQIVHIQQNRRMRSEETHYIDHPKIGILVRLTPPPDKNKN